MPARNPDHEIDALITERVFASRDRERGLHPADGDGADPVVGPVGFAVGPHPQLEAVVLLLFLREVEGQRGRVELQGGDAVLRRVARAKFVRRHKRRDVRAECGHEGGRYEILVLIPVHNVYLPRTRHVVKL
jgi:hypothetical protein